MKLISIFLFALYFSACLADLYMHQHRGSNNRLNEQSANRQNGNRLFDSQNNNRGGYNVGEMGRENGFNNNQNAYATDSSMFDYENRDWYDNNDDGKKQFEEVFLESSLQSVTWTAQHGCGNAKNNCNMVLEYTCDTHPQDVNMVNNNAPANNAVPDDGNQRAEWSDVDVRRYNTFTGLRVQLKNGANTGTPDDPNNIGDIRGTFQNNNNANEGRHESEEYYVYAKKRDRNQNLFTADQKLQGDDSTKTRQNPGGTRRGLEVPEERDYFPYWRPTVWKPVAIFHNDMQECETQMRAPLLDNTRTTAEPIAKGDRVACVPNRAQVNGQLNNNQLNQLVNAADQAACTAAQGEWIVQNFADDAYKLPAGYPQCVQNSWSQVNNLGNVKDTGKGGLPQNWDWVMPSLDELKDSGCYVYTSNEQTANNQAIQYVRMVTRMRYNMTTMDYAPYETDASCNQNDNAGVQSPVEQNPTVDVGVEMQGLRLALNTAQTGRTFQDRSHVYRVEKAPAAIAAKTAAADSNLINVSVQGKRGNIVQTFPSVEYDFWPKIVDMKAGKDCIALQWTGSNTHNNGNPAGDGQAGDAGEGRGGSDRSNMIQLMDKNSTFPAPYDKAVVTDFFAASDVYRTYTGAAVASGTPLNAANLPDSQTLSGRDAQLYMLSGGFWNNEAEVNQNNNAEYQLNVLLNNAPASMRGLTVCPKAGSQGTYEFTCTRNNNFSNRDQKLTINVTP
jgi:hypothetical protein